MRVEHWDTAIEQGKAAARAMLGHAPTYDRLPYFFTDQYDLGMEYVGSVGPDGYDEVVLRGDTTAAGGRTFTAFWLKGDRVLAGMHANDWDATDHLRAIVGKRVRGGPAARRVLSLDRARQGRHRLTDETGQTG